MGHGTSKQEPGMEQRPVMKLIQLKIQLKIEKVKRRARMRKSSILSTAELLRSEEREGMVDDHSAPYAAAMVEKEKEGAGSPETIAHADVASEEKVKEEKRIDEEENVATEAAEEEEKKKELGFRGAEEDEDEKGRKLGCLTAFEDLPESPSFRFYCTDLARDSDDDDDDSVKFGGGGGEDQHSEMKENEKEKKMAHKRDDSTGSEDLEVKPLKKDKGRRLKPLTKAPSHVYYLLNVRNCYSHHSSTTR